MRNLIGSSLQPCIQSLLSLQKIFFQKISHPYKDHLRIIGPLQRPFAIFEDPTQNTPCEFFQVRNSPFHLEGPKVLRDLMIRITIRIFNPLFPGHEVGRLGKEGVFCRFGELGRLDLRQRNSSRQVHLLSKKVTTHP